MKQIFTIALFLLTFFSFSQDNNKPTYFYFGNQAITKQQYRKADKGKIFIRETENDTAVIKHIYLHKTVRKLDSIQHSQINQFLTKVIGENFNANKKTMIHLYKNKRDGKIYEDSNFKKYWSWIKKNSDRYQAFLIGTKDSQIKQDIKKHIYRDPYDLLKNLFFQNSEFQINHLLIKPDGEIYIYYGLDDILGVLDWSVD